MAATSQQTSVSSQGQIGWLGVAGIVTGVLLGMTKALVWSKGLVSAEVLGYAAAGIIVPSLIAYAIAGRKANRDWNKFGFWYAALGFLFLVIEINGRK